MDCILDYLSTLGPGGLYAIPNIFTLSAFNNIDPATYSSGSVVVSGLGVNVQASGTTAYSGGSTDIQFSLDNINWSPTVQVFNGQTLYYQVLSPPQIGVTLTYSVTIGSLTKSSTITTSSSSSYTIINGAFSEEGRVSTLDAEGNSYLTGTSGTTPNCFLAKVSNAGSLVWATNFSETNVVVAMVTDSTHVYLLAYASCRIFKFSKADGSLVAAKTLNAPGNDYYYDLYMDADGNIVAPGHCDGAGGGGGYDMMLVKFDKDLNVIWSSRYGGTYQDTGYCVAGHLGGYIVGGASRTDLYLYTQSAGLFKYDANGVLLWQVYFGPATWGPSVKDIVVSGDDIYTLLTHSTSAAVGTERIQITKHTGSTLVWAKAYYPSSGGYTGDQIAINSLGDLVVSISNGQTYNNTTVYITLSLSAVDGSLKYQNLLRSTNSNIAVSPFGLDLDGFGNMYAAFTTFISSGGDRALNIWKLPDDGSKNGTFGSTFQIGGISGNTLTGGSGTRTKTAITVRTGSTMDPSNLSVSVGSSTMTATNTIT